MFQPGLPDFQFLDRQRRKLRRVMDTSLRDLDDRLRNHFRQRVVTILDANDIRLRWALRDIKAKRTKLTPVNPSDLKTLIEMGLIEMRDDGLRARSSSQLERGHQLYQSEPPRDCRRLFCLSHAATAVSATLA